MGQAHQKASVAVIVVHGVADQQPGETAGAFIEMMAASEFDGDGSAVRYRADGTDAFTLPVPVLAPQDWKDAPPKVDHDPGVAKAFKQSISSDFFRERPAQDDATTDRGLAYMHYLLRKAAGRTPSSHYTSQRTRVVRTSNGHEQRAIDVWEMYWADQSRLSGAMPRIATELFTMFFRLSRLGRDAVDEARRHATGGPDSAAWRWLSRLQTTIDWSFTYVLAQLFFQLLLIGLFLVVAGIIAPATTTRAPAEVTSFELVLRVAAGALAVVAALGALYFRSAPVRCFAALLLAGIFVAVAFFPLIGWVVAAALLILGAYGATLSWVEDRFPFALHSGLLVGALVLVQAFAHVTQTHPDSPLDVALLSFAAMTAFEFELFAIKWWFVAMALPFAVWVFLSTFLTWRARSRRDYQARGGAATGRLGTLLSMLTFLIVAMALWAALSLAFDAALAGRCHWPAVWKAEGLSTAACIALPVDNASAVDPVWASAFAQLRFDASTQTFAFNALVLLVVVLYILTMFVPSLLAEFQIVTTSRKPEARRLGSWLTGFYRRLDWAVLFVTLVGATFAVLVGLHFAGMLQMAWLASRADDAARFLGASSKTLLNWFVIPAASALAALSVLGGLLSRFLPGIRAPLDAALDVDNYMREFPRGGIPRVRIYSRYAALLDAIRERGYERVVIVSHSQGTVISADLLRYLSSTSLQRTQKGRSERLKSLLRTRSIRLLTLGCPLRQLYASRFPALYRWVLDDDQREPDGPQAEDVGVDTWFNAFGSGDYVGRWLWSERSAKGTAFHPLNDRLDLKKPLGRELAYDCFEPMPPRLDELFGPNAAREAETCIGFAAHTHYFDLPHLAARVTPTAALADRLIAGEFIAEENA